MLWKVRKKKETSTNTVVSTHVHRSHNYFLFFLGSAMEALHSIQNFLKGRPKSFKSVDHAIEWRLEAQKC